MFSEEIPQAHKATQVFPYFEKEKVIFFCRYIKLSRKSIEMCEKYPKFNMFQHAENNESAFATDAVLSTNFQFCFLQTPAKCWVQTFYVQTPKF